MLMARPNHKECSQVPNSFFHKALFVFPNPKKGCKPLVRKHLPQNVKMFLTKFFLIFPFTENSLLRIKLNIPLSLNNTKQTIHTEHIKSLFSNSSHPQIVGKGLLNQVINAKYNEIFCKV